jgi:hypothetical protein
MAMLEGDFFLKKTNLLDGIVCRGRFCSLCSAGVSTRPVDEEAGVGDGRGGVERHGQAAATAQRRQRARGGRRAGRGGGRAAKNGGGRRRTREGARRRQRRFGGGDSIPEICGIPNRTGPCTLQGCKSRYWYRFGS